MTLHADVLCAIGHTPLLELRRAAPAGMTLLLKAEHLNPGGSHKARIAMEMVLQAERDGWLSPGSCQTVLEPTGGNTGIGIAMACAVRGYQAVLVVPDNYSVGKQSLLRAMGARVILSDSTRGNNSHGERAMELQFAHPDWVMLNQGANPANPQAHRHGTAVEILADLGPHRPDVLVAGVGTGGHLTGVGQVLRAQFPDLRIVAVEPEGCSLVQQRYRRHGIQGLAIGYCPPSLDRGLLSGIAHVSESEALAGMRALMRSEGVCAGISTGANIAAVLSLAQSEPPGTCFLTFSYDGSSDYLDLLAEPADESASLTGSDR